MSSPSPNDLTAIAPFTFDHVPTLKELLPLNIGVPGVVYNQICNPNAKAAQDEGWGTVVGAKLFTITGPKGSVDMVLACKGTPIKSASSHEGARKMFLDDDIYRLTGCWLGYLPENLQEEFKVDELRQPLDTDSASESSVAVTIPPKQGSLAAAVATVS